MHRVYRNCNGRLYKVIAVGRHTETKDKLIIYQDLYEPNSTWISQEHLFQDKFLHNGKIINGFTYLENFPLPRPSKTVNSCFRPELMDQTLAEPTNNPEQPKMLSINE
jgi:hypothetical protein